jgi:hypothetical protein
LPAHQVRKLPTAGTLEDYETLLPWKMKTKLLVLTESNTGGREKAFI